MKKTSTAATPDAGTAAVHEPFSARILYRLAFVCLLLQLVLFYRFIVDDAFISFRYARNWVLGNGLVFNLGELVEGYSNLLWVLLLAAMNWLGLDLVLASKLLGLVVILGVLVVAERLTRRVCENDALCASGTVLLLASSFGVVFFGITGLETVFFSGWLLLGAYCFIANENSIGPAATLCLYAAALTRPEGVLYFGAAVLVEVLRTRSINRRLLSALALFAGLYAAMLLWRHSYYGDWLPNTFYAKPPTHDSDVPPVVLALNEVYAFLLGTGGALFVLLVIAVLLRRRRAEVVLLAAFCLVGLSFQLYSGGDWMQACRFLVPIVPFYVILGVAGLAECARAVASASSSQLLGARTEVGLAAAFVVLAAANMIESGRFYMQRDTYPNFVMTSEDLIPAAQWVGAHYQSQYAIVCWRTGALAYFSGMTVIDATYGLTDRYVARHRFSGSWDAGVRDAYLRDRKPELLMNGGNVGTTPDPSVVVGGRQYDFVRKFSQGGFQEWYLYQRAAVSDEGRD